jgi:hypothetical protein
MRFPGQRFPLIDRTGIPGRFFLFAAVFLLSCLMLLSATIRTAHSLDTSNDNWALISGYGQSIPGWGETTQRVETIDLIGRYRHVMLNEIGSGWLTGHYATLVELPLHAVISPVVSTMIGVNFLACYTFTAHDQWRPYLFGGGGPVYSFADIPGMGADWNGNYQFGLGMEHPLNTSQSLLVEIRYHHISNAGTKDPNDPLNSIKVLMGISF